MIKAEIITIGDEILYGQITDTNTQWISAELDKIGIKTVRKSSVGDTKEAILRLGAELIQQVGYHAFSYADIAKKLDIKNAAVHYHFPAKADLYESIVDTHILNYTRMGQEMEQASILFFSFASISLKSL